MFEPVDINTKSKGGESPPVQTMDYKISVFCDTL